MEDTMGIGLIGKTGRGTCEYHDIPAEKVDLISFSAGVGIGGIGGFAVGSKRFGFHQRLNSIGYVFTASLPPSQCTAATTGLQVLMEDGEKMITALQQCVLNFHVGLGQIPGVTIEGHPKVPQIHIRLKEHLEDDLEERKVIQGLVDDIRAQGILVARTIYSTKEPFKKYPSICVRIHAKLGAEKCREIGEKIRNVISKRV